MTKLVLCTQAPGYSAAFGTGVVATALDGGRSRIRADVLNPSKVVSVSWSLTAEQYNYLMAFYHTTVSEGALPFEVDLVIDDSDIVEHTAHFVPGSLRLDAKRGPIYQVSAQLEAEPIVRDAVADAALVAAYNSAHGDP